MILNKMVEVFKTNVQMEHECRELLKILYHTFPAFKMNFDLEDCDKILRVAGSQIQPENIIEVLKSNGYHCEVLD